MQNWNQWQLPGGPAAAPMPQPPIGYAAPGADPMATMQSYLQYFNQPAPSGYTAEQWAAAQQQNWTQWQTWQQQYQQWQAQYGEKYQETLKQMSTQAVVNLPQVTASMNVQPPPLPKEDTTSKPPLPPDNSGFGFPGIPPPHQNNLPLFPSGQSANPPLPPGQPPLPPDNTHNTNTDNNSSGKRTGSSNVESVSAKKLKVEDEELTQAEKTFDAQFKQWEEQFNKWKQQNANHPDKTQYKQYEAKWTSWREKLIERREQMRRKREQQKQAAAKVEAEKGKTMGDDKILNILSSTENQGLINNLLGIGKTLGLTGKNDAPAPPPGPPPMTSMHQPPTGQPPPMATSTMPPNMNQAAWAAQQWAAQYNAGMNMANYGTGYQQPAVAPSVLPNPQSTGMSNFSQSAGNFNQQPGNFNQPPGNYNQPPGNFSQPPATFAQPPGNFNQPPPSRLGGGMSFPNAPPNIGGPNMSLPPPGFGPSNNRPQTDSGPGQRLVEGNLQDSSMRPLRPDNNQRQGQSACRDSIGPGTERYGFEGNRFTGPPPNDLSGANRGGPFSTDSYGRDGPNKDFGNPFGPGSDNARRDDKGTGFSPSGRTGNDFRPADRFNSEGDRFGFDRDQGSNRFGSDKQETRGDNRDNFNTDRFGPNNDRFGSNNDRFGPNNDRFGPSNDRFGSDNDRFGPNNDAFGSTNDRFGSNTNRFGSTNDRFGMSNDRFGSNNDQPKPDFDRFGSSMDRLRSSNDQSKPDSDRFGSSVDRFRPGNDRFSLGDRFGPSNDRLPLSADRSILPNDKFARPPLDRFDSRDGSRDSGGSGSRGFGKSNQFDPPPDMPPEFQKLMEKRKAAMDVFKPSTFGSFFDSNKSSSDSPSLSESFRRITGDSPFLSRSSSDFGKKDNLTARGPPMSSTMTSGPGNFESSRELRPGNNRNFDFRGPSDFRPPGSGDFPTRGSEDFRPRGNEFAPRDSGDFGPRGSEFGPRDSGEFGPRGNDFPSRPPDATGDGPRRLGEFGPRIGSEFPPRTEDKFESSTKNEEMQNRDNLENTEKPSSTTENSDRLQGPPAQEDGAKDLPEQHKEADESFKECSIDSGKPNDDGGQQNVPPLQAPPWMSSMSSDFVDDDVVEVPVCKSEKPASGDSSKDTTQPLADENSSHVPEESENTSMGNEKKSDALPFMGENDPKPEDLNMEPPPELPNLGPIKESEPILDKKERPTSSSFGHQPGDVDRQMNSPMKGPVPFGPRGPNDSRLPPFGPRGMGGSSSFGPRGFPDFRPSGPPDFGPHGPPPFGPRGPSDFGPRGPPDFGPRGPSDFGPRGPPDFGPRGPSNFGPRGPPDFGPRGPSDFGPRGPPDFGPRGPPDFGPRGPSDFGSRGPSDFGPRGPPDLGPRGPPDFGPRGPGDFGPRDPNDRPFGPRAMGPFGPRTPFDRPFGPPGPNNAPFGQKSPFGPNAFGPRGNIPSLMSFKFDRPIGSSEDGPPKNDDLEENQCDLPLAFRGGDQDQRPFGGDQRDDREKMDEGSGVNSSQSADWRQPFGRNKFGDSDERSGNSNAPAAGNQMEIDRDKMLPTNINRNEDLPRFGPEEKMLADEKSIKPLDDIASNRFDEKSSGLKEKDRMEGPNFMPRQFDDRPCNDGPRKEFCVEKQFNYNHSGGVPDEVLKEHTPANVIDYGHAPRIIVHDYVTPVQCFDYGHGNLKPTVTEHEVYPKKDFRYWVENEQNLREYTDRMKLYESDLRALRSGPHERSAPPQLYRERNLRNLDDRRSFDRDRRPVSAYRNDRSRRDRDRDDNRDRDRDRERRRESRERGRIERDREWERSSIRHREDRSHHRRSNSKDRTRERPEKVRKETNKENKKDEKRSKGNVSGQESSTKKPTETTIPDNSQPESKDAVPEEKQETVEVPPIVELPKPMELPTTMELPKTSNFTMVDDLLCQPSRQNRPPKIVVILRGPPGSGKSFVAKLIKDKEVEQGGSAPRILSLDDYFLTEKEIESVDDNGKKVTTKEMVYEYEEAMEPSYMTSLVKAFKKNITDGFFNFIILDSINEKISDYEEMWSFAKTKGFRVYVCEMEMDVQICLKRNIHNRTEDEINRIVDYFEPTPGYHQKLDVTSMLQEEAIEEVHMEDSQEAVEEPVNDDSQDSQEDPQDPAGVSKWERMEAEDKLDRLDGLAKRKTEGKPQTMEDFLQVPDYYNMEDTSGKKRVRWADLEERKEQEKMRAVGFVVGQTNWDRMMDPTKGGSALTRTKYI